MSENSNPSSNEKFLSQLSNQIDQTLNEDRRNALIRVRKDLVEKSLTSDLSIEKIPQKIILKMQKYCQIVAFESDIWKVNYALKMCSDLLEAMFYKNFFESKREIEIKMVNLVRKKLSSLPNDIVPFYSLDEKLQPITQNNIYDSELPSLAERFYDHLVAKKEQNGEWNLEYNLKTRVNIERENRVC